MNGLIKNKNIILIPMLVISLLVFNVPASVLFAEEAPTPTPTPEITPTPVPTPTPTPTPTPAPEPASPLESDESDLTEQTAPTPDETVIETGDAVSEGDIENVINENVAEIEYAETDVENGNAAEVENEAEVIAETGENIISGGGGGASVIATGNSAAVANVINVVNTNLFDSNLLTMFLNLFGGISGDIDFRGSEPFSAFGSGSNFESAGNSCSACMDFEIKNENSASILNNVIARASAGSNAIANGGDSYIETGDAYAAANVFNMANTNLVDSQYLLLVVNGFGGLNGDLVLPGKDFFSNVFNQRNRGRTAAARASNENSAAVENDVNVAAHTGSNSAEAGNDAIIQTGDANSYANVLNQVNTNIFGKGNSFTMLIRAPANWSGNVFSAPEGIKWAQTPLGIQIFSDEDLEDDDGLEDSGCVLCAGKKAENANEARITNNVQVYALTGENEINGASGAEISTGDAYAAANVINVANTNVIGKNWMMAIVNIFGNWNGNVVFGRPDLWIGAQATSREDGSSMGPGAKVRYHFTVSNLGDADATGVKITDIFDGSLMSFIPDGACDFSGSRAAWSIGNVLAGETKDFFADARISGDIPFGQTSVNNFISVESAETDGDLANNTDELVLMAYRENPVSSYGRRVILTPDPILHVAKRNNVSGPIAASSTVDYEIIITNDGGSAYHSVLVDTIKDKEGNVIHEENWDLDEIFPDEEITITYSVVFSEETKPGIYTNYAQVNAIGRNPSLNPFYGWFADSNIATTSIEVVAQESETEEEISETENSEENILAGIAEQVTIIGKNANRIKRQINDGIASGRFTYRLANIFTAPAGEEEIGKEEKIQEQEHENRTRTIVPPTPGVGEGGEEKGTKIFFLRLGAGLGLWIKEAKLPYIFNDFYKNFIEGFSNLNLRIKMDLWEKTKSLLPLRLSHL